MARPKIYDREQVLTNAMLTFWNQGYEATGMRDLIEGTGLRASSLYHSFGNKEELFLAVLDFYLENVVSQRINTYLKQEDPLLGIEEFFISCFRDLPKGMDGMSCLMVNTMVEMAGKNEDIRLKLEAAQESMFSDLAETVNRAKSNGQLSESIDTEVLARQLGLSLHGLLAASKIVKSGPKMVTAAQESVSFILESAIAKA